jgi:hypothetical protein
MLLPLLAGGMAVKGIFDAEKQKKQKLAQSKADATNIQFSPWSGINVSNLAGKDYSSQGALSGMMTGGLAGAQTGMNINNALADQGLSKAKANYYSKLQPPTLEEILAGEANPLQSASLA